MHWLADRVTKHPVVVIIACLLLTGVAAVKLPELKTTFTFRSLYAYPGNPEVPILDRYLDEFGDDAGFVAVLIETDDVFREEVLRYIQQVSRALERQPVFRRVRSLSVNHVPRGLGDEVIIGPLYRKVPKTKAELEQIRRAAMSSQLLVPRLISRDGRATVIAAEMRTPVPLATFDEQDKAVGIVRATVKKFTPPAGAKIRVGGTPSVEVETGQLLQSEENKFGGLAFGLIVVVLLLVFGSLHGLLLPLTNVAFSVVCVLGAMGWSGKQLSLYTSILPTVLLIYGLLDAVFLMSRYYALIDEGRDRRAAARGMILSLGFPCLLASVTTALGFASFALTGLPHLVDLGLFLAFGVMLAFVFSVAWLPAVLSLVPSPRQGYRRRLASRFASAVVARSKQLVSRRPGVIVAVGVVLLLATGTVALLGNVIAGTYNTILSKGSEGVEVGNVVSAKLGGVVRSALVVEGPPGAMEDPAVLRAIDRVDRWAEKHSLTRTSLSLPDLIRAMNQAFHGGDAKQHVIPKSKSLVAQYLALLDPHTRSDFVSDDYARTHVRILSEDTGSHLLLRFVDELRGAARRELEPLKLRVTITGYAPASWPAQTKIVRDTVHSFFLAFGVIALLVGVAFRSARLALLSIVPNLIPMAVLMAVLPLTGTWLWVGEATVLCVAVGIVFDNTIHLYAHLKELRGGGAALAEGIEQMLDAKGPPMVFTSLLVALGFGIFLISKFQPLEVLGLGCIVVIVVGLVADLLLTPALLLLFGNKALPQG